MSSEGREQQGGVQSAATLTGRRIVLRPVTPPDYQFLFELSQREDVTFRWRLRNSTPSFEAFAAGLFQGVLAQYLIVSRDTDENLGLITAYNADLKNGFVYLALLVRPESHSTRATLDATLLFLNLLFESWPFRKVYFETTDLSYSTFASGDGRLFTIEGVFRDHEWYAGRYWDMYVGAFLRSTWESKLKRMTVSVAARQ